MSHTGANLLPADTECALLLGRVWRDDSGGPALVAVRDGALVDLSCHAASMAELLDQPELLHIARHAPGMTLGPAQAVLANELAAQAHSLKGSGGSMGFDDLYDPALALEAAAQAGDEVAAGRLLALLDTRAARIRSGQSGHVGTTGPATDITNTQHPAQVTA